MYKASWGHLKDRYIHRKDTIFRVNSPAPNQINLCLQYIHAEKTCNISNFEKIYTLVAL